MLYAYNLTTGEYAMTIPFETEIEDGRTNIAPPEVSENEVAVFDKDSEIILMGRDGDSKTYKVSDMCPYPFDSEDL